MSSSRLGAVNTATNRSPTIALHSDDAERTCRCGLFDGDRLGKVAGFVDVVATGPGDRRREYLQWNR
jgi:hypothetical protein